MSHAHPITYLLSELSNHPELQQEFAHDPQGVAKKLNLGEKDMATVGDIHAGHTQKVEEAVGKELDAGGFGGSFIRGGMLTTLIHHIREKAEKKQ